MLKTKEPRQHRGVETITKTKSSNYDKLKHFPPISHIIRKAFNRGEVDYIKIICALIRH